MFDKVIGGNPDGSRSKVKGVVENWARAVSDPIAAPQPKRE
jgi:hypothetical protein